MSFPAFWGHSGARRDRDRAQAGAAKCRRHEQRGQVVTPRQLIEAIESMPAEPWPARYHAAARDGRIRLTLPASAIADYSEAEARRHFAAAGLDIDLDIVGNDQAASLRRTRSDLHETTFASQRSLVGA